MLLVRPGTAESGEATITGLRRTDDLTAGLFVYGANIPVDTRIESVDSATEITLTNTLSVDGTVNLEITTAIVGVYLERYNALRDIKTVIDQRGDFIELFLRQESNVDRDAYNSIKKRDNTEPLMKIRAFPVQFNPSEKQLEQAGIREQANVILYTATLDWMNAGYNFNDIEIDGRFTANLQGQVYELKNKGLFGQMNDVYKYITLGLFKR